MTFLVVASPRYAGEVATLCQVLALVKLRARSAKSPMRCVLQRARDSTSEVILSEPERFEGADHDATGRPLGRNFRLNSDTVRFAGKARASRIDPHL